MRWADLVMLRCLAMDEHAGLPRFLPSSAQVPWSVWGKAQQAVDAEEGRPVQAEMVPSAG